MLKITEIVYDNSNIKINVMKVSNNKKTFFIYYKRRAQNIKQSSLLKTLIKLNVVKNKLKVSGFYMKVSNLYYHCFMINNNTWYLFHANYWVCAPQYYPHFTQDLF